MPTSSCLIVCERSRRKGRRSRSNITGRVRDSRRHRWAYNIPIYFVKKYFFYWFLTRSDSVRCQRRWGSGCARAVSQTRASARQTPLDIHETRGPRAIPPSLRMWSGKPGTILLLRLHFLLSRDFRVARAVCRVGFVGFFSVFLFLFICLTATRFYEQTYRLCVWRPRQLGFCARSPLSFSRCIAIYIYRKRERESPQQQTDATRYILCLAFVCQEEKEEISRFRILLWKEERYDWGVRWIVFCAAADDSGRDLEEKIAQVGGSLRV